VAAQRVVDGLERVAHAHRDAVSIM
jgi:hypothetical protein